MNILFLSSRAHLINVFEGDKVTVTNNPLTEAVLEDQDYLITYDYKYDVPGYVIEKFGNRAINLQLSYLPWCKGENPILMSLLYGTPRGVTIHFLEGEQDIIAQRYLRYDIEDTIKTFTEKVYDCLDDMFTKVWPHIRAGKARRYKQSTRYTSADKEQFEYLLTEGEDTLVNNIIGRGVKKNDYTGLRERKHL